MKRGELKQDRMQRVIAYLHWHGRANLAQISRHLHIPKSTVFDYVREIERDYTYRMVRRN